jgi:hypothetical protein
MLMGLEQRDLTSLWETKKWMHRKRRKRWERENIKYGVLYMVVPMYGNEFIYIARLIVSLL